MLQYGNHDLAKLLNPAAEAHNVFDASDEDIYQAVMDVKGVWGLSATSGGDDNDHDGPVESAPTRNEALQAVLLLHKYTRDLNDPFARRLETMLGSFRQQTQAQEMQSMRDTKLTSYFSRNEA